MTSGSEVTEAVRAAASAILTGTGASAWRYFEDGHFEAAEQPVVVSHAIGLIEGVAVALGLTPLELLDDLGMDEDD